MTIVRANGQIRSHSNENEWKKEKVKSPTNENFKIAHKICLEMLNEHEME